MPPPKKDYVIRVHCVLGDCWLTEPSDEDEPSSLATTCDPELIARYSDFIEARKVLRAAVKQHPARSFRMDTMDAIDAAIAKGASA